MLHFYTFFLATCCDSVSHVTGVMHSHYKVGPGERGLWKGGTIPFNKMRHMMLKKLEMPKPEHEADQPLL